MVCGCGGENVFSTVYLTSSDCMSHGSMKITRVGSGHQVAADV